MLRKRLVTVWLIGLCVLSAPLVSAQTTGSIAGTVKDSTGGVLPGVAITVTNLETGTTRDAVTDAEGRYTATNLNIGQYQVAANLSGFQPVVQRGIVLTIGRQAVVDLTLGLSDLTEDITVSGDAPLVDTRSGSMGAIVDRSTILEVPLNGRDLTGLITLQAGTTMTTTTSDGASQGYSNKFSIGGSRVGDNSVLLDGTEVRSMDQGVPAGVSGNFLGGEAIQEFKVEKNSYSAEFGGSSGGVINVVSKSGTNVFHGSVYGFTRNDAMDALAFRATEKPNFWRAQYGASAGGKIITNKTFFFGNFEGLRERLGFTNFVNTLSADGRRGILRNRTVTVNPAVVPYLALWPLPADAVDLGDGTARYSTTEQQPTNEDFYQGRVDHNLSNTDAIFGRVTRQVSNRSTPQPISRWVSNNKVYNTFVTSEYRKILSSSLLNTFRFGFNRRGIGDFSTETPGVDSSLFIVPPERWLFPMGADPIMGSLIVSGLTTAGLGRGWVDRDTNRFQFIDALVYTRGAQTWKFGIDWTLMHMGGDNPSRPGGELTFSSIDALLRGTPRQFRGDVLPETDWNRNLRWNQLGAYVQNDWQLASRVTVNLGLRYDIYTVPTEKDGKYANLKSPRTDTTYTVLGTNGDQWWKNPSFTNFAPRVGVSWDPTGSGKMAIRAGAGLFHNLIQPEAFRQFAWRMAPFALETTISAAEGVIPWPRGTYDYIIGLGSAQGALFLFPYDDAENARMYQWNVNVQRELWGNMGITVGYAGSRGIDLVNQVYQNAARATVVNDRYFFPVGTTRPNRTFNQDMPSLVNDGASWYNSFQVELSRRFKDGWQMQVAYTLGKSEDLGSQHTPTFEGTAGGASVYTYDAEFGKGLSAFDIRQRVSASAIWQLPGGNGDGLTHAILGGWQLSGIINIADGAPASITIASISALANLGVGSQGSGFPADLVAGGNPNPVTGDPDAYFDVTQFAFPPTRTIGNVGRNTLTGPGLATVDMSLTKNFKMGQQSKIQLRFEVFNLLDRVNLGTPATQVFNATGSRLASAGFIEDSSTTARQIQLGLRFDW